MYAKICRIAKIFYYRDKFKEAEGKIRNTWNILREALNTPKKSNIFPGYFMSMSNEKIRSNKEIANGFNDFFFQYRENTG